MARDGNIRPIRRHGGQNRQVMSFVHSRRAAAGVAGLGLSELDLHCDHAAMTDKTATDEGRKGLVAQRLAAGLES